MKTAYNTIKIVAIAAVLACLMPAATNADLYVRIDEHGAYHFTDTPMSSEYVKAHVFSRPGQVPEPAGEYEAIIREVSENSGLRPELVKAVILVESGFNPGAVSAKGARGLMQLMPVQFRSYNIDDPFDPRQNITAGTRYLEKLLKRYNGNLNLSLAAYNAGPAAVDHYRGVPPYRETRQYVQKVLLYYRHYRETGE